MTLPSSGKSPVLYLYHPLHWIMWEGKTAEERAVGHRNTIVQDCHGNTILSVGWHFRECVQSDVFAHVERILLLKCVCQKAKRKTYDQQTKTNK